MVIEFTKIYNTTTAVTDRDLHEFEFRYTEATGFCEFFLNGVKLADSTTGSLYNQKFTVLGKTKLFLSSGLSESQAEFSVLGRHTEINIT